MIWLTDMPQVEGFCLGFSLYFSLILTVNILLNRFLPLIFHLKRRYRPAVLRDHHRLMHVFCFLLFFFLLSCPLFLWVYQCLPRFVTPVNLVRHDLWFVLIGHNASIRLRRLLAHNIRRPRLHQKPFRIRRNLTQLLHIHVPIRTGRGWRHRTRWLWPPHPRLSLSNIRLKRACHPIFHLLLCLIHLELPSPIRLRL